MHDVSSALETVGSTRRWVFFTGTDRAGPGLALDLMEEFRPFIADRLTLSLINLQQVQERGSKRWIPAPCTMSDDTRKTVLVAYQERKAGRDHAPLPRRKSRWLAYCSTSRRSSYTVICGETSTDIRRSSGSRGGTPMMVLVSYDVAQKTPAARVASIGWPRLVKTSARGCSIPFSNAS